MQTQTHKVRVRSKKDIFGFLSVVLLQALATWRPFSSTTRSPSSLKNSPCCAGRRSSTVSDGRQSLTPFGETTIGLLSRIGCFSMASRRASSVTPGSPSFRSAKGFSFSRSSARSGWPVRAAKLRDQHPRRRRFQIFDDMRLDAGVADEAEHIARGAAFRVVVDDHVHQRSFQIPKPLKLPCVRISASQQATSSAGAQPRLLPQQSSMRKAARRPIAPTSAR